MAEVDILPLAFLYADGQREIRGITRFQKMVFLAQEETSVGHQYRFRPEKYGPFSHELYDALERIKQEGLMREQTQTSPAGNEMYVYSLTSRGSGTVEHIRTEKEQSFDALFVAAKRIKRQHGSEPLNQLLRYVYDSYPEYAVNSELNIKNL